MNTIEKIFHLIKQNNTNAANVAKDLGFGNSQFTSWKNGVAKPSSEAITKIARYFNVTTDYLLGLPEKEKPTSEDMDLSRFREILSNKGLSVNDVKNLSDNQLSTIADIIKNFKQ